VGAVPPEPKQVLVKDLPRLQELVLVLKPTPVQRSLYKAKIRDATGGYGTANTEGGPGNGGKGNGLLALHTEMLRIYNHPVSYLT